MARPTIYCSIDLQGEPDQIDALKARCLRMRDDALSFDFSTLVPPPPEIVMIDSTAISPALYATAFVALHDAGSDPRVFDERVQSCLTRARRMYFGDQDVDFETLSAQIAKAGQTTGRDLLADGRLYLAALERTGVLTALEWRQEFWGTPDNATGFDCLGNRSGFTTFCFETKDSSPTPIFKALASAFPGLRGEVVCGEDEVWVFSGRIEDGALFVVTDENEVSAAPEP